MGSPSFGKRTAIIEAVVVKLISLIKSKEAGSGAKIETSVIRILNKCNQNLKQMKTNYGIMTTSRVTPNFI